MSKPTLIFLLKMLQTASVEGTVERPMKAPREDVSTEIWNLPNSLTLFRIFLVPFLVVVLLTKFYGRECGGLAISFPAPPPAFPDAFFPRRYNQITRLGTLLDP